MKKNINILTKGIAFAFVVAIGYGCGHERPQSELVDEGAGTASAIVEGNPSAANLNNPRPAPIGDTAQTGNQADRFGNLPANVDSTARQQVELDKQRQLEANPDQKPTVRAPANRRIDGAGTNQ